ncbi:MAG: hypothetical protein KDJ34_10715 [Candidatus Competibacteraceae bacterium]|nr:hypothetical protein [Candidatus Competibacteraceae bacterium]
MTAKLNNFLILLLFSLNSVVAYAQQLNERKYVPPDSAATINKIIASQGSMGADLVDPALINKGKDCTVKVGSVNLQPGETAPKEVVTVVKGDVINVCK